MNKYYLNPELRKKIVESAEAKVMQAIQAIKAAPDNTYGDDDEKIAGRVLEEIAKRKAIQQPAEPDKDCL